SANKNDADYLRKRLDYPSPRIETGLSLRNTASACIDISDGLAADLGHILKASGVGATLQVDQFPVSDSLRNTVSLDESIRLALTAGDDYELCFTVPMEREAALEELPVSCTRIGSIEAQSDLRLLDANNLPYPMERNGFDHFRK
ncbi:MAG: thiamine-phosphate kinase, partial [Gammaproteobacteria bacterium]|nr:thiamine-phosphate kinase [Gammaproteobacteria bacterium]